MTGRVIYDDRDPSAVVVEASQKSGFLGRSPGAAPQGIPGSAEALKRARSQQRLRMEPTGVGCWEEGECSRSVCAVPCSAPKARFATEMEENEWAASKLQSLERGRQLRKQQTSMGNIARQAQLVGQAKAKFRRLAPLEGKLLQGGFPGAPINASMALALAEAPRHASCARSPNPSHPLLRSRVL